MPKIAFIGYDFPFDGLKLKLGILGLPHTLVHIHPLRLSATGRHMPKVETILDAIPRDVDGVYIHDELDGATDGITLSLARGYKIATGKAVLLHCMSDYAGQFSFTPYDVTDDQIRAIFREVFPF